MGQLKGKTTARETTMKIPDEVVREAVDIINRDFPYSPEDDTVRAALEVAARWAMGEAAKECVRIADKRGLAGVTAMECRDAIRARKDEL